MSEAVVPDEKRMRLRYAGVCRVCGTGLAKGESAVYERSSRTVRCLTCPSGEVVAEALSAPVPAEVDPGVPGASARREFERRQARRVDRIRTRHRRLGGLILALSDDPQSTRAWDTGAVGEERLGARLSTMSGDALRVLHDRRVPGSRANIDHVAITPSGVVVVDAKRYRGRPRQVVEGGLLRPRVERLTVGGRDRTSIVEGVLRQVEVVRGLLGADIPVRGVLCFVEADWPLVGGSFRVRSVDVLWPKRLTSMLATTGDLTAGDIAHVHAALAQALPPA